MFCIRKREARKISGTSKKVDYNAAGVKYTAMETDLEELVLDYIPEEKR